MGKKESGGSSKSSVVLAFFIGGLVGAGIGLLLAPRPGKESREKIKELAEQTREKVTQYAEEVKNKVTSTVEKSKGLFEAGKEAYAKQKEKLGKG